MFFDEVFSAVDTGTIFHDPAFSEVDTSDIASPEVSPHNSLEKAWPFGRKKWKKLSAVFQKAQLKSW